MNEGQEPVATPEPNETENFISESAEPEFVKEEAPAAPAAESEVEGNADPEAENKTDEANEGEPKETKSGDDPPAEPEEKAPKKVSRSEKRIKQLVTKNSAAERRAEKAEARIAELEGKKEAKAPESRTEPTAPDESDYPGDYGKYLDDLDKYDERMAKKPEAKAEEPEATEKPDTPPSLSDSQQEALDIIKESIDNFDKPDDFDEKVLGNNFKFSPEMMEAVSTCDDPAAMAYHLANDKELTAELTNKTPAQVARELVKIEDGLNAKPVKPIKTSNTPEPIKPVGKGSDSQEIPDSELSFSDYEKRQNEKERNQSSHY